MYFDKQKLVSYHLNCYAKGGWKGDLDWNYNKQFEQYIPKSTYPLTDSITIKFDDLQHIYNLLDIDSSRHIIVFFWSNMVRKHIIKAFGIVSNNVHTYIKNKKEQPQIILINTDEAFIQHFNENNKE